MELDDVCLVTGFTNAMFVIVAMFPKFVTARDEDTYYGCYPFTAGFTQTMGAIVSLL